jgi:hypothetical protein
MTSSVLSQRPHKTEPHVYPWNGVAPLFLPPRTSREVGDPSRFSCCATSHGNFRIKSHGATRARKSTIPDVETSP